MDKNIFQIAGRIAQLYQEAYEIYLLLVDDVCNRKVSEDELSHLLDYLQYPSCIKFYIEGYREMWEDEGEYLEHDL